VKPEEIEALLALQELDLKLLEYEQHQDALPRYIEEIEMPLKIAEIAKGQKKHKRVPLKKAGI